MGEVTQLTYMTHAWLILIWQTGGVYFEVYTTTEQKMQLILCVKTEQYDAVHHMCDM